ncbi:ABC transporter substrate-binding protein [Cytobacillus sp. FJAT-54145]|uniref:ABC transporter substrate-binding protein n=1 Tax=Cytobacillus spartinae TaxID=3299023 RepID=A0ABW6KFK0_9BACI
MKKLYSLLFLMLLSVGILAGCGEEETAPVEEKDAGEQVEKVEEPAFPVTIKDAIDEDVVIEAKPEKIVSLIPSNTEIAFELGLAEEIVGVSDYDNYPEETANKEKIGGMEMNVEKIISLAPDLVLAHASSAHNSTEGLQQLRDSGIAVLVVNDAQNFDQVFESIEMIGKATGEQESATTLVANIKEKLEEIKTKAAEVTEKKSVFIEVSPAPEIYSPAKNTFMDEMLTIINADNVLNDQEGWVQVDQEAIIERNPDVIVTTYGYYSEDPVGQVTTREGWQNVSAVVNSQVVDIHSDLVSRTGPRLIEGVEELAKAVYPDVFNQ